MLFFLNKTARRGVLPAPARKSADAGVHCHGDPDGRNGSEWVLGHLCPRIEDGHGKIRGEIQVSCGY